MKNYWLSVSFLVTQLAAGSFAQQPTATPSPPPVLQQRPQQPEHEDVVRITTNLVQVDAVVTDKSGKPVTDLKPEEIEIFEDGRKQKITNFSYILAESSEVRPTNADLLADEKHRMATQWMDFEIVK